MVTFFLFLTLLVSHGEAAIQEVKIGDIMSDFDLPVMNEGYISGKLKAKKIKLSKILKEYDGAVIMFISKKCPFSQAYHDRYRKLDALLASVEGAKKTKKRYALLGINSNNTESVEDVKKHAETQQFQFPVLRDEGNIVADLYGARKTPETYLIDKNRKLLYWGRIDDDMDPSKVEKEDLKLAVSQFAKGLKIKNPKAGAFGCGIKKKLKAVLLILLFSISLRAGDIVELPAGKVSSIKQPRCAFLYVWATWCTICVEKCLN